MAHDRARATPPPGESLTPLADGSAEPLALDTSDLGAIDKLLAETDQGWDVEAQVLTLKQAAAVDPLTGAPMASIPPPAVSAPAKSHTLSIPTPFELSPSYSLPTTPLEERSEQARTPRPSKAKKPPAVPPPSAPAVPVAVRPPRRRGPPPLPSAGESRDRSHGGSAAARVPADMAQPGALVELLHARIATLQDAADPIGLARAYMELAVAVEASLGDDPRAEAHAEAALTVCPELSSAHAMLRRKRHSRAALGEMLAHLDHELAAALSETHRVELLAEKARLLGALGDRSAEVRATWEQALAHAPHHAGALKGLEAELVSRALASGAPADWEDWGLLAVHLARMADAYGSDARLAAWLHVERAQVLERKLGRSDAARGSLERALELDPSVGPVRGALARHVATHADWDALVRLLDDEARIEESAVRGARLELDAAAVALAPLGDRPRACALLERAAARAPTTPAVDRRVLDELVRLHSLAGRSAEESRARRARIALITDPSAIAYELQSLATAAERSGDLETAIADVQNAIAVDASYPLLVDTQDRLLQASGKNDLRVAMWLQEAARTDDSVRRARALARAACVCEELGKRGDALRHLRSAWIACPGDGDVLDALARQLAPARTEPSDASARALVDLYAQAAEHEVEVGRKVAYIERVALLWEEVLGDPVRAARAYEEVLALEGDRRSALLGLERTAARAGDGRARARALLEEGKLTADPATQLTLRTRAAAALADLDPARAIHLVREVLEQEPALAAARVLETQLEEKAGRWDGAARSLRARIEAAPATSEKVALWLTLARMQQQLLHAPLDAMHSLEQAFALDPAHPVPPDEIVRLLEDHGDPTALRDALERMAARSSTSDDRGRYLARVAEIDELSLSDDERAIRTLQRALTDSPDDDLIADRLTRVVARHARRSAGVELGELATLLAKRIARAPSVEAAGALSFDLAALLVELGREPVRATALLETSLAEHGDHAPALRTLESLHRRAGDLAPLARVLDKQGDLLNDARARLGALWNLAALEEWRLPVGDPAATYRRILALDPTDPGALEATLRRELANARSGDPRALQAAVDALRALVSLASDDDSRCTLQHLLATLLERAAAQAPEARASDDLAREALGRYRDALRIDELSVTASTGVARLAGRFHDTEAAYAAARSLAEIAVEPRVRARYLVEAAEILLGRDEDDRLGPLRDRKGQAASMLERALEADPDSIAAAGRLAGVLHEEHRAERVVSAFRSALARATSADAAVMLGSETARIARDQLQDLTVAIDAMRRVRAVAPQHVPSLFTLAELCIAQRIWPEAVEALEAVVSNARDAPSKLTALFALASVYEKVLARPRDVERVLRAAVAVDPNSARALGALVRRIAAEPVETAGPHAAEAQRARRTEIADLLGRLAQAEKEPDQKSAILIELAEVRSRLGDGKGAERALVEAVAASPANAHALERLATLFEGPGGRDHAGFARALSAVIALGQQLGAVDARWFAALGRLETQALSRMRDGIVHLQRAVALDPTLYEARFELASAYGRTAAHDEAARVLVGMLLPAGRPLLSLPEPPAALALLEKELSADRRPEEALVVGELRTIAHQVDDASRARLRARRLPPLAAQQPTFDRTTLVTQVLPHDGRHILLEVAAAIAGVEAKVARDDLSSVGLSARERISSRDRHPTRAVLDRLARQLGVGEVEFAFSPSVARVRVLSQDVPWLVAPDALLQMPEMTQAVHLARALARIAFGVPWLEELTPPRIEAFLVAAGRLALASSGAEVAHLRSSPLVASYEASLGRALSRKQRRLLEELAPHISSAQSGPFAVDAFVHALLRAEVRAAFILTGDLLSLVDALGAGDPALRKATTAPGPHALSAVLEHPLAGDAARFALTAEATALRRRLGAAWTG